MDTVYYSEQKRTSVDRGSEEGEKPEHWTEIADFNAAMGTDFSDEDYDTVGGLVLSKFGRLPKRGESIEFDGLKVQVLRADSRRVHTLVVERLVAAPQLPLEV